MALDSSELDDPWTKTDKEEEKEKEEKKEEKSDHEGEYSEQKEPDETNEHVEEQVPETTTTKTLSPPDMSDVDDKEDKDESQDESQNEDKDESEGEKPQPTEHEQEQRQEEQPELEQENDFGDDDDDDDFGDFGDAQQADSNDLDDDFDTPVQAPVQSQPQTPNISSSTPVTVPAASPIDIQSSELYTNITSRLDSLFDNMDSHLSPEQERPIERVEHVLTVDTQRQVLDALQNTKQEPVDWRRSRVRRQMLIRLGIPIDLDEIALPSSKTLPPLRLKPSRAATTDSQTNSTSSTPPPPGTVTPNNQPKGPPPRRKPAPIDRERADSLLQLDQDKMSLLPLYQLENIQSDLQAFILSASETLTYLLEEKDELESESRTFDTIIQNLVSTARKTKLPSSTGLSRSTSISSR